MLFKDAMNLNYPAGGGAEARRPATAPPLPRQAGAARWRWLWRWRRQRRWRQPGGRGRSARLAPLLPREAQGTLSRAAAPRPVCSLGLGAHGGATHPRGREVRECEARGERRAPVGLRGAAMRAQSQAAHWPRSGGPR